jgi:NAD(P)-dependent dehydrogenase (short-subunit alcohol dehydrogenase family)
MTITSANGRREVSAPSAGEVLGYAGTEAVVTGAASGMGAAVVDILVGLGAHVSAVDRQPVARDDVTFVPTDLLDQAAIDAAVAALPAQVNSVFSCAGLPGPPFANEDTVTVNFVAARHLVDSLVPRMPAGGAIACISSNAAMSWQDVLDTLRPMLATGSFAEGRAWLSANPDAIAGAYGFSKQLLSAWVGIRAMELASAGLRLNVSQPGPTETAMLPKFNDQVGAKLVDAFIGPIGRHSTAEEQAWPLVFLNSPRMSYVSGIPLYVDGGFYGGWASGVIDLQEVIAKALA